MRHIFASHDAFTWVMMITNEICLWFVRLVGFYGISTTVGYLMPSHVFRYICCIAMIQLYKYTDAGKCETLTDLHYSGTKRLFTSWLLVFRHEERETMMTVPTSPTVNSPSWSGPAQSQISTNVFFEITKNLSHSLPGMTSFTPQSHFLSGVSIMTFVIAISSAHERVLYSICAAPILALRAE